MPPFNSVKPATKPHVTISGGNRANFLSSWFFLWVFRMLKLSRTYNLCDDNLNLQDSERAKTVGDKLEGYWRLEYDNRNSRKPSIRRALLSSFGVSYAFLGIYKLIGAIFLFLGSYYLVNRLIKYVESENDSTPESYASGHIFALGLFLCALLSSIFINQVMSESTRIGVQVRAALMVLIYRKSLQLSSVGGNIGNIGALGSFDRLDEFLMKQEMELFKQGDELIEEDPALRIYFNDADFKYEGSSDQALKFLNLKVKEGEVIAIVGDVGAGKSSILSAIIGHIRKENGVRKIRGSISYVPHDAWLLNTTLKDNILFGNAFDAKRYKEVLHVCALNRDLELLSYGDLTEIGDRGVNLSLGQRQRFLSECSHIMVMKNGVCIEEGTYDELIDRDVNFASLISECMEIEDPDQIYELTNEIRLEPVLREENEIPEELENVIVEGSKSVSSTYHNNHNNVVFANGQTINRIIEQNLHTIQNANINERTITKIIENNQHSVLGGAGKDRAMGLTVNREYNATARAVERNQLTIHSFKGLEDISMIGSNLRRRKPKILQVYIDYFRKSTGITVTLLMILTFCFVAAVKIFSGIYNCLMVTILIGVFARGVFFAWVVMRKSQSMHNRTFLGLEERFKVLDADSKPPIFAHLSASLEGLASIRVYNAQTRFDSMNLERIDANNKALFAMMQVKFWQSLYIDIMASIFVYTTALFVIVFYNKSISPSTAGLAVANAMQLLIFGQWMVHSGRDVATNMDSVQQLLYFREGIPSEASNIVESNRPPSDWGERGEIEFKHVTLRYNIYGVAVLRNISFHIRPREKVGIVGKTGSGKSTLLISLLRIVESTEGQIYIDNLDISTIGLRDLRNKIAIIPQEPVIFAGTIRSNLDPFNKCTDDEIWAALKEVHLQDKVKSMHDKLNTQVLENGKNFSLGQRQLFCIARALLKKTNILVLDEATSAVDPQTDLIIRETIKKNFEDHTILTIAHRLNTIMEADRILCLDEGRVIEFDEPGHLLDNPEGFFYNLVARMGPETAEKLRNMAGIYGSRTSSNDRSTGGIRNLSISTNEPISEDSQETVITPPPTPINQYPHRTHMPPSLGEVFQRLSESNPSSTHNDKNDVK
ncbi:15547_t:CDS:10 [Acaulospora colombiana]|uniref:15547_t:CDS:1 n=1 Tax=Acaulospora colombiana TaxID=27376 RepID=A0ACA9KXD8_9GLOM|nr:15547_t:CDS:10 [Acaulospora colombiana]